MRPLELLRRRPRAFASVAIATIGLIGFALASLQQLAGLHRQELEAFRVGNWFALQAQSHVARTLVMLHDAALGQVPFDPDALRNQFEVAWSRIDVMDTEEAAATVLGKLLDADFLNELRSEFTLADPDLELFQPGDHATYGRLQARLHHVAWRLTDLTLSLNRNRVQTIAEIDGKGLAVLRRFGVSISCIVLAGGVLVLLLLRALVRQEDHLNVAQAAAFEAGAARRDLQGVIDAVPAIITVTDGSGRFRLVNHHFEQVFGVGATESLGRSAAELGLPIRSAPPRDTALDAFVESTFGGAQGERTFLRRAVVMSDSHGVESSIVEIGLDITERRRAEERIRYLATHDLLTGLGNRETLLDKLEGLEEGQGDERSGALLLLDLDGFKDVNDTLGHAVGDALLIAVGERLASAMPEARPVCRLGGDEFAAWIEPAPDPACLAALLARLRRTLTAPFLTMGQEIRVGASVGVSLAPEHGRSGGDLLRHADVALYAAKRGGRNAAMLFDRAMAEELRLRKRLEADLRQAIAADQLAVAYQPKYDLATGAIVGAEALARWFHPELGAISPAVFVPIAEETGLIAELGHLVLRQACRQIAAWEGILGERAFTLAINLSTVQLMRKDIVTVVRSAIEEAGIRPQRLELEVTESVLVRDFDRAVATLHALRDLDLKIALDDFGTGYSSLSYLVQLPIDKLKLDRSFVVAMDEQPAGRSLVASIISLAHGLGLRVIAEGIESEAQAHGLRDIRCDEAQGFHFSRPLSAAALARELTLSTPSASRPRPRRRAAIEPVVAKAAVNASPAPTARGAGPDGRLPTVQDLASRPPRAA